MNERIKSIAEAATLLFLRQGYAKTQISHIAKAVGVSVGTIYLDFSGKKEIMQFILKSTIDPKFPERDFERPITDGLFAGLEQEIIQTLERTSADFAAPLENRTVGNCFRSMVEDAFDMLSRYAAGCLFIEKNQFDFKVLAVHYKTYRQKFFETVVKYLQLFMETGELRPLEHVELSAMLIIELLSWWAMDMRYTSFETNIISPELAKQVCLDNILHAYQR